MTQAGRILALVLAGVCALMACLWALGEHTGRLHRADMAAQRDAYLLRQLRTTAENYLATGLQLEQLQALQEMLEREQAAFSGIITIDVFSPDGTVLYSTDTGSRGGPVPGEWRALLAQQEPWQGAAPGQRQIGQRFDNDLGQAAGGIVLTLTTAKEPPTLMQWYESSRHLLDWLVVGLLAALAAVGLVQLGLRRLGRPYDAAARILSATDPPPEAAGQTPLAHAARQQRLAWQAGLQRAREGMEHLEAIDHEG
ncbi:hypothetical protein [Melaminivora sp.]|uniref:hypothetical protein n=1 Tax=Melaminivora sp. TaxID=1933032 RepID=UPI0028ADB824|nr:hypothetical protein [Melaminivora sp.]